MFPLMSFTSRIPGTSHQHQLSLKSSRTPDFPWFFHGFPRILPGFARSLWPLGRQRHGAHRRAGAAQGSPGGAWRRGFAGGPAVLRRGYGGQWGATRPLGNHGVLDEFVRFSMEVFWWQYPIPKKVSRNNWAEKT